MDQYTQLMNSITVLYTAHKQLRMCEPAAMMLMHSIIYLEAQANAVMRGL